MTFSGRLLNQMTAMGVLSPDMEQDWFGDAADSAKNNIKSKSAHIAIPENLMGPKIDTSRTSLLDLPLVGKIHFISERAGCLQAGFVILYWIYGMWSTNYLILMPHYDGKQIGKELFYFYSGIGICTLMSFIKVSTMSPGRVFEYMEDSSDPEDPTWTWCQVCQFRRPPRAHHCRRCKHCVLRMDHHCPWINNCVGEENHYAFWQLIFWAFTMSVCSTVLCVMHMWYLPPCTTCDKAAFYMRHGDGLAVLTLVLAIAMMFASTGLLCMHHIGFLTDMTTIDWMKLQKELQQTGYGPHISLPMAKKTCTQGYRDFFGRGFLLCYIFPCYWRRFARSLTYTPTQRHL